MDSNPKGTRRSLRIKSATEVQAKFVTERRNDGGDYSEAIAEIDEQTSKLTVEDSNVKPKVLFGDEDVTGTELYPFNTPVRGQTLTQKAITERMKTPVTYQAPAQVQKLLLKQEEVVEDNGVKKQWRVHGLRNKRSSYHSQQSSESESVSEDEYEPDEDEESDESEIDSNDDHDGSSSDSDHSEQNIRKVKSVPKVEPPKKQSTIKKAVKPKSKIGGSEFHVQPEEYFIIQSEKSHTSNNTLGKLKNRMDEQTMQALLVDKNYISDDHKNSMTILSENCEDYFDKWIFVMDQGFNILLYGLGSKRHLINKFHKTTIYDYPTLIVNGFFPSLTIKEILDGIVVDILGKTRILNQSDCFDVIEETMRCNPDDRLYLLIHNIDGAMLRSKKAQDILSRLAEIPNIHLVASVDHINAPLLWDNVKRSRYNFYYHDATTFLPYDEETSYEDSMLLHRSGALALSSLRNVFLSLTPNARDIYIVLVKYQLENGGGNNYSGMAFRKLYHSCKDSFLATAELALRAHLSEFLDHKLVKKRNVDGIEHLVIPLEHSLLKQFLELHET